MFRLMVRKNGLCNIVLWLIMGISHGVCAQVYSTPPLSGTPGLSSGVRLAKNLEHWVQGSVVLVTGDTVPCEMSYNPAVEEGLLQVKDGEGMLTLSVKDVTSFFYFDTEKSKTRRYYSMPVHDENASITREYFLEHVYENADMAILSRRVVRLGGNLFNSLTEVVPVDLNFLLDVHTGTLQELKEAEAMALMKSKSDQVKAYMKTNGIKLKSDVKDYILVFNYYASL